MTRSGRAVGLAVVASLLLHAGLLGVLPWPLPEAGKAADVPPFEARLAPLPPVAPRVAVLPEIAAPHARATPVPPQRAPGSAPEPAPPAPAIPESVAEDGLIPVLPEAEVRVPALPERAAEAPAESSRPVLNVLPPRLELRFDVRYGFAAGEQTLQWVNEGERYTLTSVASATGLAGMFYRGRFVQTSRGRITPHGLQPEEFWDQRGDKRSSARFVPAQGLLTLTPEQGAPRHFAYEGEVQDALSLFFQLALTAPPRESLRYAVFNGKKLRDYRYEVLGETTLETAIGPQRTLHLARAADRDGRFEAWLAIDRHYLPVRVLRSDEQGNAMELRVRSIAP